jgi:hypothetical protein
LKQDCTGQPTFSTVAKEEEIKKKKKEEYKENQLAKSDLYTFGNSSDPKEKK